jgi:hypothetical protein
MSDFMLSINDCHAKKSICKPDCGLSETMVAIIYILRRAILDN